MKNFFIILSSAEAETKCTNPRLEPAENGFVMSWNESKKSKGSTYDGYGFGEQKEKVFKLPDDADKVMKEFIALCKSCGFAMTGADEEENAESPEEEKSEYSG